jgi:CRP-like cAMP-binding protein
VTVTEFLKGHVPFLSGLTDDQAAYLARSAEQKSFGKGQTVIFQGVTVDGLHVVAQGKVTVFVRPPKSKEAVQVAQLGPGDIFGEASVVDFTTATATIKAAENDTLVFVIPEAAFNKILAIDDDFKAKIVGLIEARKKDNAAQQKPKTS